MQGMLHWGVCKSHLFSPFFLDANSNRGLTACAVHFGHCEHCPHGMAVLKGSSCRRWTHLGWYHFNSFSRKLASTSKHHSSTQQVVQITHAQRRLAGIKNAARSKKSKLKFSLAKLNWDLNTSSTNLECNTSDEHAPFKLLQLETQCQIVIPHPNVWVVTVTKTLHHLAESRPGSLWLCKIPLLRTCHETWWKRGRKVWELGSREDYIRESQGGDWKLTFKTIRL